MWLLSGVSMLLFYFTERLQKWHPRLARARGMGEAEPRVLVLKPTEGRTHSFLGEPGVNVLELNLDLDQTHPFVRSL